MYTERKYTTDLVHTNIKKATAQKAKTYHLPETTTPEML